MRIKLHDACESILLMLKDQMGAVLTSTPASVTVLTGSPCDGMGAGDGLTVVVGGQKGGIASTSSTFLFHKQDLFFSRIVSSF